MNSTFNIKVPMQKDLRKFGVLFFIIFAILGGLFFWKKGNIGFLFLILSGFFLFCGLIIPDFLKYFYTSWMKLARILGFIMTHFILSLIYYLIFTPIGFAMKLFGKIPLVLKIDKDKKSYWIKKQNVEISNEKYQKMF